MKDTMEKLLKILGWCAVISLLIDTVTKPAVSQAF